MNEENSKSGGGGEREQPKAGEPTGEGFDRWFKRFCLSDTWLKVAGLGNIRDAAFHGWIGGAFWVACQNAGEEGQGASDAPALCELILEMPTDRRRNPILDGFQGLPPGEYRFVLATPKQEPGAASNGESQGNLQAEFEHLFQALNAGHDVASGRIPSQGVQEIIKRGHLARDRIKAVVLATPHTGSQGAEQPSTPDPDPVAPEPRKLKTIINLPQCEVILMGDFSPSMAAMILREAAERAQMVAENPGILRAAAFPPKAPGEPRATKLKP